MAKKILSICLISFFIISSVSYPQKLIKAKIAIMHRYGDEYKPLRSNDRVHAGEMFRIFIKPFNDCYIYVINTDNTGSNIIFDSHVKAEGDTLILPSKDEFYVYDDKTPNSKITIFCSLKRIREVENLFAKKKETTETTWDQVESVLLNKFNKNLNEKSAKPFSLAGNVSSANDEFIEKQRILTGKDLIIRKYEIEVQK
jgi:hypothetical protein